MQSDPREVAVRILCDEGDASRVSYYEGIHDLRDRALARQLASGALEWRGLLDAHIAGFSTRRTASLRPLVLNTLRVGAFQLLFTAIPPYAAVNSVVSLLSHPGERSFVNGVLRAISRSAGHVELPSLDGDPVLYASVRFSHPRWIAAMFHQRFGLSAALKLCAHDNKPPPLVLRVNGLRTTPGEFTGLLESAGYHALSGLTPGAVRLEEGADVTTLPGFQEGLFVVQDEGAGAASAVLNPRAGERVWDVCAAPGGKTSHLAEIMAGAGEVYATDIDPARAAMIDETVRRLQLPNVRTGVQDALRIEGAEGDLVYDKILLDAPCSGLGVLRRHADLRWNRKQSDIVKMAGRQTALLGAVASRLRPSGVLVYSTCTLTWEENEGVWKDFLRKHPQFKPLDPAARAGEWGCLFAEEPFAGEGYRYILPQDHGTDGFFVACAAREG